MKSDIKRRKLNYINNYCDIHTEFSTIVETLLLGRGTCHEDLSRSLPVLALVGLSGTSPPLLLGERTSPRFCSNSLKSR